MNLAGVSVFRPRWAEEIHHESVRNLLANQPALDPEKIALTRDRMNTSVPDCLVTGYKDLIESLNLPDANDRHVLAAAIRCGASSIMTFNLRDFPDEALRAYNVVAQHPDGFLAQCLKINPTLFLTAVKLHCDSLRKPPMNATEFLDNLERQQLPLTVAALRRFADVI